MMRRGSGMGRRVRWGTSGLALVLAGCLGGLGEIGAPSQPTRFYSLAAVASEGQSVSGVGLGLSPVRVPDYLDRAQIVTRPGPNDLEIADFHRWGEPVHQAISRVVAANLSEQLGVDRVQRYPWRQAKAVSVPIEIDVLRMEGPLEGPVSFEALWQLRVAGQPVEGVTRASEPVEGSGYSAYAAALSRALATLSEDIAEAVRARAGATAAGS